MVAGYPTTPGPDPGNQLRPTLVSGCTLSSSMPVASVDNRHVVRGVVDIALGALSGSPGRDDDNGVESAATLIPQCPEWGGLHVDTAWRFNKLSSQQPEARQSAFSDAINDLAKPT